MDNPASGNEIEGFTDRISAQPGEPVSLLVSTSAETFRVHAYRVGWYVGGDGRLVWRSNDLRGGRQADPILHPAQTRTVVAPWRSSLMLPTGNWPPGAYLLKLTGSHGKQAHVPFFVRSESARGAVALVAPVTTWQAYNDWGGYSLYRGPHGDNRAWRVSFDRPYPAPGAGQMAFGVIPVVRRAERLGIPLAYFTNVDLHADPTALDGARAYVSMGHDEYWTLPMRTQVMGARDTGANLFVMGANTMYWRIRLENTSLGAHRAVVGYRHDAHLDPVQSAANTDKFRDPPAAKPENSLTGMLYECFPVDAPFRVVTPRWWGYAGTGVHRGEEFDHLVGIEADRVYPLPSTPRPMQVVAHTSYSCGGAPTTAQSVYYTSPSGAGVFNVGTLRWTCALRAWCPDELERRTVRFVQKVTDTVLRRFSQGPAGERFPAEDNVNKFDLPVVNGVPAS